MFDVDEMIEEFLAEAQEHRAQIEELLLGMEQCAPHELSKMVNELFRAVHSIKGAAGTVELDNICDLTHAMETELSKVREGELSVSSELISALLGALDVLGSMLDHIDEQERIDTAPAIARLTCCSSGQESDTSEPQRTQECPEPESNPGTASSCEAERSGSELSAAVVETFVANSSSEGQRKSVNESIRVPVWALDSLMALAGELVLVRNRQLQSIDERLRTDRNNVSSMDRQLAQQLDLVTSEIQEAVLRTRMQPIGIAFQKLPRLCRDLANKLGKRIAYKVSGSETEVDKTILECLSDPLMHLVRNSCDHGLGAPSERSKAGKEPTGTVSVSAHQDGGQIVIRVQDDGRGIDPQRVGQKAVENGVCRPEELAGMSDKQVCMLIFSPGFSTASTVSDISGRGVGMDVVKTSIEKIGGSVDVFSKLGEGTTFSMRVPLTLAIVSSLIVRCGKSCFAIPQVNLEEVVCLHDEEVFQNVEFINNSPSYRLRGQLLPLVYLEDVLGHRDSIPKSALLERRNFFESFPPNSLTFAVVRLGTQSFGIVVDEAIGTEEIVVKPNHPILSKVRCFVGTTVLGDGRIALILDVNGVAQHASIESRFCEDGSEQETISRPKEVLSQLAFTLNGEDLCMFPLSLISRIISIYTDSIDEVGGIRTVNLDGDSIRVVDIAKHLGEPVGSDSGEMALILPRHIKRSVGFLCKRVLDIKQVEKMPSSETHLHPAILGSFVLDGKLGLMLDMFALARCEEPSWFESEKFEGDRRVIPRRVLLAEDTGFFRRVVGAYLVELGYHVEIVEDGQLAADKLRLHDHGFDVLISDLEMPNLDGFGLIEKLRRGSDWEHCRSLPAMAMSSLSSPEVQKKAIALGFDLYELKLNRESLRDSLEELLGQSRHRSHAA